MTKDCEYWHEFLNCPAERILRKHKGDKETIKRKLAKYHFNINRCMRCDKFKKREKQ